MPVELNGSMLGLTKEKVRSMVNATKNAFEMAKIVTGSSSPIYLSGGMIRSLLLENEITFSDYDFLGDFDLDDIQRRFPDLIIGRWDNVSTVKLRLGSANYDFIATKDVKETLNTWDMTLSTICLRDDGELFDYFEGINSLHTRVLKMNNPEEKVHINPNNILRVFRLASELGFSIEGLTLKAAILNAFLLEGADYMEELWGILSLDYNTRMSVLKSLYLYDVDRHIDYPYDFSSEMRDIFSLEEEIRRQAPIETVNGLFNCEAYLVGGSVRDIIWGKKVKDFDFKIKLPISEIIRILEAKGYAKTTNLNLQESQYYVNDHAKTVSIFANGVDIDFTEMITTDIPTLANQGDVNFSCCVFNTNSGKVENPDLIRIIKSKELHFCDPTHAKEDPLIIVNALKQISRVPDIKIPGETREVILACIPNIVNFISEHPEFRYKIASLCGNINSEEVYALFDKVTDSRLMFSGIERKRQKLIAGNQYISLTLEELTESEEVDIIHLLKGAYGKHFDPTKVFSGNVNSVVVKKRNGKVNACCLVDGERIYAAAARQGDAWIAIFADLVRNNYNVWGTIDCANPKVQALSTIGGLKMETDPSVIKRILASKCNKRPEKIDVYRYNGMVVFREVDREGYPQVLLRS